MIQTEQLIMSPHGFRIATASPAQRAACRIIDGLPLGDLRAHPDVLQLVGGAEVIECLPSELGIASTEVMILAAIRCLKSIMACAAGLRMTQTVDVSRLGPGEVPRVSLVSLKLDLAAVAHRLLLETIRASRVLNPLLIEATADTLTIRHPSGRPIEIACVAGAKAGSGLVARWSAGVVFDEAPRMAAADDAVVNLEDARTAILGRLLPGAQALYIGSPWAPHGPIYNLVNEHWRKPSANIVVLRGTGPILNPSWWTPERCAKLLAQNPTAHRTDVEGEFADPESGLLNPAAVIRNTRPVTLELLYDRESEYFAAVDPSEGTAGGNGFSLVIIEQPGARQWHDLGLPVAHAKAPSSKWRVALCREWRGYTPAHCWREIASVCFRYRIKTARTDQYAAAANADLAKLYGLRLEVDKATAASNVEDFTNLATLIHDDRIELSPDPTLRTDLLNVKRRVTQQGVRIVLPRTAGRHADYASALCAAVKYAMTPGQELAPATLPQGFF